MSDEGNSHAASFRAKLVIAIMLVVGGLTASGLYLAQRKAAADLQRDLQRDFQSDLTALHSVEELRYAALAERCRALVAKPRIHAALEDNALDLLYPSAKDELRDIMDETNSQPDQISGVPHARFYRFLDRAGAPLAPPNPAEVGPLHADEEAQLSLKPLPQTPQIGYLLRGAGTAEETIDEIIALPITSTESNEVIAALVIGFKPLEVVQKRGAEDMKSGIWLNGWLHLPALPESARTVVDQEMTRLLAQPDTAERSSHIDIEGGPYLLFFKLLNPQSTFPAVYEVCVYPLRTAMARQERLRWQILGAGAVLLLLGFIASHLIAKRLSAPVAKLASDSEENRVRRQRVEAALASTHEELERSTRFSADASHQLKTPVTVLRLGLEEMLRRENLEPALYEELSALHHQTYRLTGVIDDLLLLSRMDAGHLKIEFTPVNLSQLIEEWLDDLNALPDPLGLEVKTHLPPLLSISGERRYTSPVLQNLLENARKYNRPGGRIHISARAENGWIYLTVGNTGRPIPREMQPFIFERFSRGAHGEQIAGHGLGLNLARELVRLHGGDLNLVSSNQEWTEFEVRFRPAGNAATNSQPRA